MIIISDDDDDEPVRFTASRTRKPVPEKSIISPDEFGIAHLCKWSGYFRISIYGLLRRSVDKFTTLSYQNFKFRVHGDLIGPSKPGMKDMAGFPLSGCKCRGANLCSASGRESQPNAGRLAPAITKSPI